MQALSHTSFVVLGLVDRFGPLTPYGMKKLIAQSLANFWPPVAHSKVYAEAERLAADGYLDERREAHGRRRKRYHMTDAGREALRVWLAEPDTRPAEIRDPGLVQVFFGADPEPIAAARIRHHAAKLAELEELQAVAPRHPPGPRAVLGRGISYERESLVAWESLLRGSREAKDAPAA
jgi:PadR family transcriptional regulator, regulatory protein AphA